MIRIILWSISFISLYLTIVWLQCLYYSHYLQERKKIPHRSLPFVTIAIPAYNEEKTILKTLHSLLELKYPPDKLELLVIDNGSTDRTVQNVQDFISQFIFRQRNAPALRLFTLKNPGKAAALNHALSQARGTYFGCVDADSTVGRDSLLALVPHFEDEKVGAVISIIKVNNPHTIYARMQRIEYAISALTRSLMSAIDTLAVTPGVLSVYRKEVLQNVGGFAEGNMTEDFEIALRLKYYGYRIVLERKSITSTSVPANFRKLQRQRIRWFRGFITNHLQYKSMFLNKRYSFFGLFQLPLNVLGVVLLLASTSIFLFSFLSTLYEFLVRSYFIDDYFFGHVLTFPSFGEIFLGQDLQIMFPIAIASILGFYFLYLAHREVKEKMIKFPFSLWLYFVIFPYLTAFHWCQAIVQEILHRKKKW